MGGAGAAKGQQAGWDKGGGVGPRVGAAIGRSVPYDRAVQVKIQVNR